MVTSRTGKSTFQTEVRKNTEYTVLKEKTVIYNFENSELITLKMNLGRNERTTFVESD